jgi:hypothetical protein
MTITSLTVRRIRDRCFFDETIDAPLAMTVLKRVGPVDDLHDLNLENAVAKLEKLARARGQGRRMAFVYNLSMLVIISLGRSVRPT